VTARARSGDAFILGSNGLSNKVTDDEMLRIVGDGPSHERACARLVGVANERGGKENVTVAVAEMARPGTGEARRVGDDYADDRGQRGVRPVDGSTPGLIQAFRRSRRGISREA
jgi:serine/threonine protein phosphatase PrpC